MKNVTATALLLMALLLPIALYWQLAAHSSLSGLLTAAIAVAAGWVLNVAWAFATQRATAQDSAQASGGNLRIAAAFGWVCPVVFVFITWLVLRFFAQSAA